MSTGSTEREISELSLLRKQVRFANAMLGMIAVFVACKTPPEMASIMAVVAVAFSTWVINELPRAAPDRVAGEQAEHQRSLGQTS